MTYSTPGGDSQLYRKQIQNRNYLSPIGFNFILAKYPKVDFFSNSASFPAITLNILQQPNYLKPIPLSGDQPTYDDLVVRFLVDENLINYMTIHNWLTGLGYPESTKQYKDLITDERGVSDPDNAFSDATLQILNSNYGVTANIKFRDAFPYSITPLDFTATDTDINYFTAQATFKYTIYDIVGPDGRTPL